MRVKAVLFDIDGTLLDTFDFVLSAVQYTLDKHKLIVSKEILVAGAGNTLLEFYKFILPEEDAELLVETHHEFQKDKHTMNKAFPNVKRLLKKLKKDKIKIVGVSNRGTESLTRSLKISGIYEYFDIIVTIDDVENPKPHQDMPLKALEILGIDKKSVIMVGDTENDILSGKNAGIKTVGVTFGFFGQEIKNSQPDFVIDKIEEILGILS